METHAKPHPFVFVPPPLLFVAAWLAGYALQRTLPPGMSPGGWWLALRPIGSVLVGAAVAFALSAMSLFAVNRTTIIPHGTSRHLVTAGPYRLTRNPMYTSLTVLYAGLSLWAGTWVALLLLPLPLLLINQFVIPFEEAQLRRTFGAEYEAYTGRVRRWF